MQVALFTDSDVYAGTERHILDLACGLRRTGCGVQIACPAEGVLAGRAEAERIAVTPIAKQGMVDRAAVKKLSELLRRGELDLIHAHNGRTALSAALAVTRSGRGCCLLTQHFLEPDHVSRRGVKGVLSHAAHLWVNRRCAHLIAISESVKERMLARREAPPHKITVVHNGIAAPDTTGPPSPEQVRQGLGLAPDAPLIVCAARLEREKEIDVLIDAMAQVGAVHPAAVCLIAGQGAQEAELRAQVCAGGWENRIRLLGFRDDVPALMRAADLFVLPSRAEPFGLVLLEAMTLARPVIATRAGGPREIVVEGETGLLVPPSNPQALAGAIGRMLREPDARREMGRRGRARFEAHFTRERMAQAIFEIYHRAHSIPGRIV